VAPVKRYELTDRQWERIKDLLPGRVDTVGMTAKDNRQFVNAVLWILRSGSPWRDLPERYGDWKNTHRRFSRWATTQVWDKIFTVLIEDTKNEYLMIDSTIVRAHQHAAGSQKKKTRRWGVPEVD
jgi:putative transposase